MARNSPYPQLKTNSPSLMADRDLKLAVVLPSLLPLGHLLSLGALGTLPLSMREAANIAEGSGHPTVASAPPPPSRSCPHGFSSFLLVPYSCPYCI